MLFIIDRRLNIKKSIFDLVENNEINIYVCGPTLYRKPHIGNFRSVIFVNFLINLFNFFNIQTNVYSSITDVGHCDDNYGTGNDKVISEANKFTLNYYDIVNNYFTYYMSIIDMLNINNNINYIAASSIMGEYFRHIDLGIKNGVFYSDSENNIRVKQSFINKNINDLIFYGSRLKEFVVWKNDKRGIANYKGNIGNPGWHIECFCIINKYFKNRNKFKVDLHIGGVDLLDIHNNAEIIHSKVENKDYNLSKFWLAIGTIKQNGRKLSKSNNNVIYVDDFIKKYNSSILKIIFFNSNIESEIDINSITINNSINLYNKIIDKIASVIYNNFDNPNYKFNQIINFIKKNASNKITNYKDLEYSLNTRNMIQTMLNIKDLKDLYISFLYDLWLNTSIFDSLINRQKDAKKFFYLQNKRIEFQNIGNYIKSDLMRKQILNSGLKIIESEKGFFIY